MSPQAGSKPLFIRKVPIWTVLLILLLCGFALFGDKGILRTFQSSREKEVLEKEIKRIEEANAALRDEIEALRSDRRYIEDIARRELGMVKQDEIIYQFPAEKGKKN
jgi:cell division protein FtsB